MRRAARCPVKYVHSHRAQTRRRFCSWGRDITWIRAQSQKVGNPVRRIRPDSKMAKFFPTTAMLPLSKYRKGRDFERPSSTAEMKRPTYRPRWIATCATPVWPAAGPVCKEFRTGVYCVIQIEMHPAAGQQSSVNLGELQ